MYMTPYRRIQVERFEPEGGPLVSIIYYDSTSNICPSFCLRQMPKTEKEQTNKNTEKAKENEVVYWVYTLRSLCVFALSLSLSRQLLFRWEESSIVKAIRNRRGRWSTGCEERLASKTCQNVDGVLIK